MRKSIYCFNPSHLAIIMTAIITILFLVSACSPGGGTPVSSPSAAASSGATVVPGTVVAPIASPGGSASAASMMLPGGITSSAQGSVSTGNIPTTCPSNFVTELTEGPFYKAGAPQRTELVEAGVNGTSFTLTGYVLDKNCAPISGAWLDFWQADGSGNYDNGNYKLRGYQITDAQGKYTLHTVFPGLYPGRTNHIHVKLSKSEALARSESSGSIVTTQLFFPGASRNSTDNIYNASMEVVLGQSNDGQYIAFFNFKIN